MSISFFNDRMIERVKLNPNATSLLERTELFVKLVDALSPEFKAPKETNLLAFRWMLKPQTKELFVLVSKRNDASFDARWSYEDITRTLLSGREFDRFIATDPANNQVLPTKALVWAAKLTSEAAAFKLFPREIQITINTLASLS